MLLLKDLIVTQQQLRNPDQLPKMVELVRKGNFFSKNMLLDKSDRLIEIAQIIRNPSDCVFYIHNGHHRCVAAYLGGRDSLREDEYYVKQWNYDDYKSINFKVELMLSLL